MIKPRIIVTGATGKTGSVVVTELLKAGYPVRALVHREDGRSARLKAQGAEIAVADMSDVERVANALKDVQRAYYCPPIDPYMIQGAAAFAVAAGWFVVTAPSGRAASDLQTAWWSSAESSNGAVPAPPTLPDGGLWVSSNPSGTVSLSAVRVTLSPGEGAPTLVLDVHQAVPPTAVQLTAYPTTSSWTPGSAQAWSSKPTFDASAKPLTRQGRA